MQTVAIQGGPVTVVGALGFDEVAGGGVIPRRLPDWTRPQLDPFTELMVKLPSGVRLEFVTDSLAIELDVKVHGFRLPGRPMREARFDLTIGTEPALTESASEMGAMIMDLATREVSYESAPACTVVFRDLPGGVKRCALWLPANAMVELLSLRVGEGVLIEPLLLPSARWVHHGSSISHCVEAESPTGTWPAVAARQAKNVELVNLGFGGSCHLDQFAARAMRDIRADLYTVKAGINIVNMDSMKERVFVPALHGFIDTLREQHATTPTVVISPIICPTAEEHPGPTLPSPDGQYRVVKIEPEIRAGSLTLQRIREIMASIVAARRAAGDTNLHYLDGLTLFGPADAASLPDGLHPSPAGYRTMGERFAAYAFGSTSPFRL